MGKHVHYPHLFTPLKIGSLLLPNRVIMGSMHTGLEARSKDANRLIAFYQERVKGGVGLIVSGGVAPSRTGLLKPFDSKLTNIWDVHHHRKITDGVHKVGGKIILQILHAGYYGFNPLNIRVGSKKSPFQSFPSLYATHLIIKHLIRSFARAAYLAYKAGYDGVEIMGGEGYLINQFLCPRTNDRQDQWGGSCENRQRFLLEVIKKIRSSVPRSFIVILRQSLADLVEGGQTWEEIIKLAKAAEHLGVDAINTDIGWHESKVPTIMTSVPRAAFVHFTRSLREAVSIPLIAANRINMPQVAETILEEGSIDAVSIARPFLADPEWVKKAKEGKSDEINTCIACNQACLDHLFIGKKVTCLVNPRACRETLLRLLPAKEKYKVAVIGAGPAGLSAAINAAKRGFKVTLFEIKTTIGGQFFLAKEIPGKEEFHETIRYFRRQLEVLGIETKLNYRVSVAELIAQGFKETIIATGVKPRIPKIPGVERKNVLTYDQAIYFPEKIGKQVAILGAGGIGFDMANFLTINHSTALDLAAWEKEWGVSRDGTIRGFVADPVLSVPTRHVTLLQRHAGRQGKMLGKTTGWVHRAEVKKKGVKQISGVQYKKIDDQGLYLTRSKENSESELLPVETVVLCVGQESVQDMVDHLADIPEMQVHLIGGAREASGMDAKSAIQEGLEAAIRLGDKREGRVLTGAKTG